MSFNVSVLPSGRSFSDDELRAASTEMRQRMRTMSLDNTASPPPGDLVAPPAKQ